MDWVKLAPVVLAALLGAALAYLVGRLRDWQNERRDAHFSALYVCLALENYARESALLVANAQNYDSSDGQIGEQCVSVAEFLDLSGQIDWKPLGVSVATEVLSFRVRVNGLRASLAGLLDIDADAAIDKASVYAVDLGRRAAGLAATLRRSHKLADLEFQDDEWNVIEELDQQWRRITSARRPSATLD